MRKLALAALIIAAAPLAACDSDQYGPDENTIVANNGVVVDLPEPEQNVSECPRKDGKPCL